MISYQSFQVLTFDCYGTLIDWERGLIAAMRLALGPAVAGQTDEALLAAFGAIEHRFETPYRPYREVLGLCLRGIGQRLGLAVSDAQAAAFGDSVGDWPAFPDSAAALQQLKQRFKLAVVTNCDDDLFRRSEAQLSVAFDFVVTAQQVGSYKPDLATFHFAHEKIGVPRERILHVAQSLFHDHVPAKQLGMTTVWIDRRSGKPGTGATPSADVVPDAVFPDLAAFARAVRQSGGQGGRHLVVIVTSRARPPRVL